MKQEEPRNYRVTIRTCTGGDIDRTKHIEVHDMTFAEYSRYELVRDSQLLDVGKWLDQLRAAAEINA